jgi:glucosamine--fructose-6-phosphate aminotransferase (isomerizing)
MTQFHMQSEIAEQPTLMRRQSQGWKKRALELKELLQSRKQLLLIGRGSSGNAALYLTYLWSITTGRQPIDFRLWLAQKGHVVGDYSDCIALAFSASGQSTDVVNSCLWLKQKGAVVIGLTAAPDASCRLGGVADEMFFLNCGLERAVPATKSFMAQMAASAALCGMPIQDRASAIASSIEKTIVSPASAQLADFLMGARTVVMLGRGLLLGAVHDAALKLQETTGLAAFAYSTAEFFHGPLGSLSDSDRVVLFLSGDSALEIRLLKTLNAMNVPVRLVNRNSLSISEEASADLAEFVSETGTGSHLSSLELTSTGHDWSDVFALIALVQMTCLSICTRLQRSPDAPAHLKKVTET